VNGTPSPAPDDLATRRATHDDIDDVAAIAADRRGNYESHQPLFW
jgi:hypothetical protein